ncbi:hypothetical protein YH66_05185 [[Brevibacterium] flavum]|uniref:Uncharacterized protein n=1 Tax=[Brevibacterium] flavum TaxID=92706 RepID=A0A0F6WQ96_9CORY|nr:MULTISPECIES: hypothetical protein [Corynebacterium]AKF26992.1 hypothetical protein YH66_05185 [[Brevibacterium] flavum]ANE07814.1 hypothetical protein A3654_05175 [Corynebacterium glutamicum]AST20230.1 hypothetical protein CEY17_05240 [Corynebacterium glutamicum ATCC 14067]KEI22704.1 hypothetical protein KIQ_009015 [Corynebacterium glutamicum ATCC 14067]KIH74249.1 hypothetical protein SD36_05210 [Corynebacterium glutamicum]
MSSTPHDDETAAWLAIDDATHDFINKIAATWTAIGLNVDEELLYQELSSVITQTHKRILKHRETELARLKRRSKR